MCEAEMPLERARMAQERRSPLGVGYPLSREFRGLRSPYNAKWVER